MIRPCSVARVAGGSIISDSSHLSYKQKCTNETVVLEEIAIKMKNEEKEKKKTKGEEHVNIKDKIQFKLNQSRQSHGKIKTKQNKKNKPSVE